MRLAIVGLTESFHSILADEIDELDMHIVSVLGGTAYLERVTVSTPAHVRRAKKAIHHAIETQEACKGFSLVEILSPCPTYWRMEPVDAMAFIDESLTETFPLGVCKDWTQP